VRDLETAMNVLEIKGLTVHFQTDQGVVEAVDQCDLLLRKGEIMGLVGESGCGKTTMGRTILKVLPSRQEGGLREDPLQWGKPLCPGRKRDE